MLAKTNTMSVCLCFLWNNFVFKLLHYNVQDDNLQTVQ